MINILHEFFMAYDTNQNQIEKFMILNGVNKVIPFIFNFYIISQIISMFPDRIQFKENIKSLTETEIWLLVDDSRHVQT